MDVHRCRFIKYEPSAIHVVKFSHASNRNAPSPKELRLAVGRANGDIEIWRPRNHWCHDLTIKGGCCRSIEGLAWARNSDVTRLFSIGYSSFVTEWSLESLKPKRTVDCNAGATWSIMVSPNQETLAVGCDNGSIVLFDITGNDIVFQKILTRVKARILSIAWKSDSVIVAGCSDSCIRVWDLQKTLAPIVAKMNVEQKYKADNFVWSVIVLKNGTIVSGDSNGCVRFWDSRLYVLKQKIQAHGADVLCLTATLEEDLIFSTGVDRKLIQYKRSEHGNWSMVKGRRIHSHDVLALDSYSSEDLDILTCGGIDTCISNVPMRSFMQIPHRVLSAVPSKSPVALAKASKRAISWSDSGIIIWDFDAMLGNGVLKSLQKLRIKLKVEEYITDCAISRDGSYIAGCTMSCTKLFHVQELNGLVQVKKIKSGLLSRLGATTIEFVPNSLKLLLGQINGEFTIIDFQNWQASENFPVYELENLNYQKSQFKALEYHKHVAAYALSQDGQKLAYSDFSNNVFCYSLETLAPIKRLPRLPSTARSITWRNNSNKFVCATSANGIVEYDLDFGNYSEWSQKYMTCMPKKLEKVLDRINGIFFDLELEYRLWIWGSSFLAFIDLDQPFPSKQMNAERKRRNSKNESWSTELIPNLMGDLISENINNGIVISKDEPELHLDCFITFKFRSILFTEILDKGHMLLIERPLSDILTEEHMPPRYHRHEYGT